MNQLVQIKQGEALQQDQETEDAKRKRSIEVLTKAVCAWYVRRDSKFYSVDRLGTKLSRDDVERACIERFATEFPQADKSADVVKEVFNRAITLKHSVREQTIPTWNGSVRCDPTVAGRAIWENGMVIANSWARPKYRDRKNVEPSCGKAGAFFDAIFTREPEREKFLDWLAWCLQNEGDKAAWAPFLYSETKGSGKSTLCFLVARLFGEENTIVQNNVDQLVNRFNGTVLTKKLIISEELNLRADSPQGNALKTFITEKETVIERKGQEAESARQCCCFLFTSNHLPLWIEENDRRYYLIEIDHDGHACGPKAEEFSRLVDELRTELEDDAIVAALYGALMMRKLAEDFSAKTLNVVKDATPLMKRVHGASEQTTMTLMREYLEEKGKHALPEAAVARIIVEDLNGNINSAKHMMTKLGWSKQQAKWGGKDYGRAIWVERGFWVERGSVKGPNGYAQSLVEHLNGSDSVLESGTIMEFEQTEEVNYDVY